MTEKLKLDFDDVAIGDLEDFEDYTGMSFTMIDNLDQMIADGKMTSKLFTGIALLALRQTNPEATIDEARRVRLSQITAERGGDEPEEYDPTTAEPVTLQPLNKARQGRRTTA